MADAQTLWLPAGTDGAARGPLGGADARAGRGATESSSALLTARASPAAVYGLANQGGVPSTVSRVTCSGAYPVASSAFW